jgi:hypothetical protein
MVPERGTGAARAVAVPRRFRDGIGDFGGIAVAMRAGMRTGGCYDAGSVELMAARHRWALGALAAGAVGMFVSALATGCAAAPADIWITALDSKGRTLTRIACAMVPAR